MNLLPPQRAFGQIRPFLDGPDDVSRVILGEDSVCLLSCTAGDCSWSLSFPKGSRLLLDCFQSYWKKTSAASPRWTLHCALLDAARDFLRATGRPGPTDDFDMVGPPYASCLALLLQDGYAHCVWTGGEQAFLIRRGQVVTASEPDTRQNNFQPIPLENLKDRSNLLYDSVSSGRKLRLKSLTWKLPAVGQVVIAGYQFPRALSATQSLELLQLQSEKDKQNWFKKHGKTWASYCVLSCEFD